MYGQLFLTKNGSKDNGVWFETLKDLTPKALESGMERLRNLSGQGKFAEFPPNCMQFKSLCLAFYEALCLPKEKDAYREIMNSIYKRHDSWSHPLIEFVAKRLPEDFFLIERDNESYAIFKSIYEQVINLIKQGHELPAQVENKRTARIRNPAIARNHLQRIKQQIGA